MRLNWPNAAVDTIDRSLVASTYLVVLIAFFITQRIFAGLSHLPSGLVVVLAGCGILFRVVELLLFRRPDHHPSRITERRFALLSITSTLALALLLAIASHEPDTPYFGMLMLPILETAVYFSFVATLAVAAASSSFSIFWVFYAADLRPPFSVGEMVEAATLILVYFIVGSLVWHLMHRIRQRNVELARRMNDLEQTRDRLLEEEKLAAVGRLASSVAHEIRNPVAIISSALEAAQQTSFAQAERDDMCRVATMEARRLEKLTSDFLSYANVSTEPFEALDLGTLAGYVEGIIRVQAMEKNLKVNLEVNTGDLCTVQGNEGQLQQVLLNLMRNAVEAAPTGSMISVSVSHSPEHEAVIRIENEGTEIPASAVNRIFEPFFTNKPNGTGLGLAIARRIVQRHNGQLSLQRNEPDHIVFMLTLPASSMPEHMHAQTH